MQTCSTETLTLSCSSLCLEATSYAKEGAVTSETSSAATQVLEGSPRKIITIKKNMAQATALSSEGSGSYHEDDGNRNFSCLPKIVPHAFCPLWESAIPSFYLNNHGAPLADRNQHRLVSFHRDIAVQRLISFLCYLKLEVVLFPGVEILIQQIVVRLA